MGATATERAQRARNPARAGGLVGTGQRAAEIRVIFPVFQPWFRTDKRVRGRDGCRVPLPWDSNPHDMGFGEHPWLPQPDYWADLSVTQQELDSRSPLNFYREMIRIRREYDLGNGTFEWGEHPDSNVVVKNSTVTLVLNMADYSATVPGETVLMASGPVDVTPEGIELPGNTAAWLI